VFDELLLQVLYKVFSVTAAPTETDGL
jgi:hypothetical protein